MDDPSLADALERIERALAARGADVHMAPGLSDKHMDELLHEAGLELPPLMRQWWRWKDGAGDAVYDERRGYFTTGWSALPLRVALLERQEALSQSPDPLGLSWDPAWLPVCGQNGGYVHAIVDMRTLEAFSLSPEDMPDQMERRAAFVTTVQAWACALEDGTYQWDPARRTFVPDQALVQAHPLMRTGLI